MSPKLFRECVCISLMFCILRKVLESYRGFYIPTINTRKLLGVFDILTKVFKLQRHFVSWKCPTAFRGAFYIGNVFETFWGVFYTIVVWNLCILVRC